MTSDKVRDILAAATELSSRMSREQALEQFAQIMGVAEDWRSKADPDLCAALDAASAEDRLRVVLTVACPAPPVLPPEPSSCASRMEYLAILRDQRVRWLEPTLAALAGHLNQAGISHILSSILPTAIVTGNRGQVIQSLSTHLVVRGTLDRVLSS